MKKDLKCSGLLTDSESLSDDTMSDSSENKEFVGKPKYSKKKSKKKAYRNWSDSDSESETNSSSESSDYKSRRKNKKYKKKSGISAKSSDHVRFRKM